jgi:hypothetical protein
VGGHLAVRKRFSKGAGETLLLFLFKIVLPEVTIRSYTKRDVEAARVFGRNRKTPRFLA